jgi:hypothetical protein
MSMHRVPAGSFARLTHPETLWQAWLDCRRRKRRRPSIAAFDLDADRHVFKLARDLDTGRYRPSAYRLSVVHDPKTRLIAAPAIRDRIVQSALIDTIGPVYEARFIDQSYAVCTGRGPQRAVLDYLGWSRRCDLRLTLDIRHYFASVDHARLLALFGQRLRDPRTLDLLAALLDAGGAVYRTPLARALPAFAAEPVPPGRGLPLGGYLSHWCGGFYLDGLDHFVKRELKVHGYLRYMDDFVLFGDAPGALEAARTAIGEWLAGERHLTLKDPAAPIRSTRAPSTFLGLRVSRAGLRPGPKQRRRLRQRLRQAESLGTRRLVEVLRAYRGVLAGLG